MFQQECICSQSVRLALLDHSNILTSFYLLCPFCFCSYTILKKKISWYLKRINTHEHKNWFLHVSGFHNNVYKLPLLWQVESLMLMQIKEVTNTSNLLLWDAKLFIYLLTSIILSTLFLLITLIWTCVEHVVFFFFLFSKVGNK